VLLLKVLQRPWKVLLQEVLLKVLLKVLQRPWKVLLQEVLL
jgi:hypothetical protein